MTRYIDKELIAWVSRANARFARMARKRAAEERDSAESVKAVADRIEAQAAEIERLEKACAEWAEVSQSNYQRAKAAEAKLAKAVELLGQWRLASAGHVSVWSVIDKHDATIAELAGSATVKDYLTTEDEKQSHEWKCPIDYPGCRKNCGSPYGCGN